MYSKNLFFARFPSWGDRRHQDIFSHKLDACNLKEAVVVPLSRKQYTESVNLFR